MKVRDLMTPDVYTLRIHDTALAAHELMERHRIRHVPLVDADNELVGLVTQRDLLRGVLAQAIELPLSARNELLRRVRLEEVMIAEPESVEPDQELVEAGGMLLENKFGCLPVVEGTTLVGILTEADFVRYVTENER